MPFISAGQIRAPAQEGQEAASRLDIPANEARALKVPAKLWTIIAVSKAWSEIRTE